MGLSGVSHANSGDMKRRSNGNVNRLEGAEGEGEDEWIDEIWFSLFSRGDSGHMVRRVALFTAFSSDAMS